MQIRIKDALVDELSGLDCIKRHLPAFDAEGNPIEKVFTTLEKQDAIKQFVYEELKTRLIQKRKEEAEKLLTVDTNVVIDAV